MMQRRKSSVNYSRAEGRGGAPRSTAVSLGSAAEPLAERSRYVLTSEDEVASSFANGNSFEYLKV